MPGRSPSLAERLEKTLRRRIRRGEYPPGSRLPSESELAESFGVSRATVRTALAKLAAQGVVMRRQGDGTYVNAHIHRVNAHMGSVWDFTRLIESNGRVPSIQVVAREERPATEQEALALDIAPGEGLLSIYRLFLADEQPVILACNLFPVALFGDAVQALDGSLPIREMLRFYARREIAFTITTVHAIALPEEAAEHLNRPAGEPLLALDVTFYGRDDVPLTIGHSFFDDHALRLSLVQGWS